MKEDQNVQIGPMFFVVCLFLINLFILLAMLLELEPL